MLEILIRVLHIRHAQGCVHDRNEQEDRCGGNLVCIISKYHLYWLSERTLKEEGAHWAHALSSIGMRHGCTIGSGVYCAICSSEDLWGRHNGEMICVRDQRWDTLNLDDQCIINAAENCLTNTWG